MRPGLRPLLAVGTGLLTLAVTGLGSTEARWASSVSLDGGRLGSAQLRLTVGDDQVRSQAYAFTSLGAAALAPRGSAQAPLTIVNAGSADLGYRLQDSAATGSTALGSAMTLQLVRVATRTGCPTGSDVADPPTPLSVVYRGALVGAGSTRRVLPAGTSEVLCVRAALVDTAPPTLRGTSTGVRLTFTASSA